MGINVTEEGKKFWISTYFGINIEKDDDIEIRKKCCERAYLDLARTIKYQYKSEDIKKNMKKEYMEKFLKKKEEVFNAVNTYIASDVYEIIGEKKGEKDWHKDACKKIIEKFSGVLDENENEGKLYYGQAQKWLNMSLKYMWLLGLVDKDKVDYLQVPVDNYILEDCWEIMDITIPTDKKRNTMFRPEKLKKPWSEWTIDQYILFQESLKKYISDETDYENSITWENDIWTKHN